MAMEEQVKYIRKHQPISFSHGNNGIESCAFCDQPLSEEHPGKVLTSWPDGKPFKEVVCNDCLATLVDYPYPSSYTIRDFPNTLNIL